MVNQRVQTMSIRSYVDNKASGRKNVIVLFTMHMSIRVSKEQRRKPRPIIWDKVFKNGPSKICGRQPLKKLKGYGRLSLQFI